jgi:hypothetical protein
MGCLNGKKLYSEFSPFLNESTKSRWAGTGHELTAPVLFHPYGIISNKNGWFFRPPPDKQKIGANTRWMTGEHYYSGK